MSRQRSCYAPLRRIALSSLLLLGAASTAFAQFDRGTISGTVKDAQGGIVPGATVTVTSTQTQQSNTTVTDGSGFYTFPNLTAGRYEMVVELSGFKKISRSNVQLDAAGAVALDFTLETGALTEEVTVTAEATALQTQVAIRKSVEAKDIELLSFSGRNPIGVPALKAGVVGGNFNNAGFSSLTNGGFSINGGRESDNTITVDGAVAIRTRASGATIGVQNADVIQEVQVLTANYLPEYGRASGGQIRFVTKSGSSRYSGNASYFYRDDSLQANTWGRNLSPNAIENSGPAPFDYKQYGYSFGGPIPGSMFKDKLFFFGAQEWVNYFAVQTNTAVVPTAAMRAGDFSQLLGSNPFFSTPQIIRNPATGLPFPNNVIPSNMLSPNGVALMNTYPLPTDGYQQGASNSIFNSDNPQDQRKDNIRFDYRLNQDNQFTYRYSNYNWVAIDAFRGTFPFARTDWDRPNSTQNINWTRTFGGNLINEFSYSYSIDQVFINVFTESGLYKRSRTGINYPYIFPARKEIEDKIPSVTVDTFSRIDGGPYPSSSEGPIHVFSNATTYVKGRHTFKAGISVEYSGEDDFDQINVNSIPSGTNNQNGEFFFNNSTTARSGLGISDMALGLFNNYAEIGERAFTKWRALATDVFVQDSWKPTSNLTVEGGIRWAIWPPWYSQTNNIASFDPRFYDPAKAPIVNPATGRLVGGDRYNGIVLPGDGFEGDGNDLLVAQDPASVGALPWRAERVLRHPLQRVRAAPGRVLRDQRQDDCSPQRRRLPQSRYAQRLVAPRRQPAVSTDGERRQRQRGQSRRRGRSDRTCPSPCKGRTPPSSTRRPTRGPPAFSARSRTGSSSMRPTSAAAVSTCSASATSTSCSRARFRRTRASPTLQRCGPTRATARCASPRTRAALSTTACS